MCACLHSGFMKSQGMALTGVNMETLSLELNMKSQGIGLTWGQTGDPS